MANKVLIICGPEGSGKSTVVDYLINSGPFVNGDMVPEKDWAEGDIPIFEMCVEEAISCERSLGLQKIDFFSILVCPPPGNFFRARLKKGGYPEEKIEDIIRESKNYLKTEIYFGKRVVHNINLVTLRDRVRKLTKEFCQTGAT